MNFKRRFFFLKTKNTKKTHLTLTLSLVGEGEVTEN